MNTSPATCGRSCGGPAGGGQDPAFAVNMEALSAAQPKDLDASEIEVRLGCNMDGQEYIQQFMRNL